MIIISSESPTVIHAAQTRRVPIMHTMGGRGSDIFRILWSEDGEEAQKDFHVG